jgi:hypothetical protein
MACRQQKSVAASPGKHQVRAARSFRHRSDPAPSPAGAGGGDAGAMSLVVPVCAASAAQLLQSQQTS